MKKTQFALAALALVASTAAFADTTVYGRLDASVSRVTGQATQMMHSNWDTSVIGVKGSDELTGGMKASFQLEGGLNTGTGESSNSGTSAGLFNRLANVSLAGDFGSTGLGLQFSPFVGSALNGVATGNESFYVNMLVMAGATGQTSYTPFVNGAQAVTPTGGFFIPNAVSYSTPNIGGISATALTQIANGNDATKPTASKYDAVAVNYAAGDLSVSGGYQKSGTAATTAYTVSAAYNMGPARIAGGYITSNPDAAGTTSTNTYHLGASYNLVENLTASVNYAKNNATSSQTLTVAGLQYSLSKRTYVYGIAGRGTNGILPLYGSLAAGNQPAATASTTGYSVGVVTNF
jgi:predicted porin